MSMGTWVLVAWAVLVLAPFVTGALCFHYGRHHERTEGKHRRTAEKLDQQWDDWRAQMGTWEEPGITGRQAAGPNPAYPAGEDMPTHPRHAECAPGPRGEVGAVAEGRPPGRIKSHRLSDAVTAADLAPVVVPPPKLTDTGELRAIGERGAAIRAAMLTSELAWREKTRLQ